MKVLLPVDDSAASAKAVQFVAQFLAARGSKDQVILYHVAEFLPEYVQSNTPEPGMTTRSEASAQAKQAKADGEALLGRQKQALVAAGVAAEAVQTKLGETDCLPESKKVAAALAIIAEMQSGNYDLVCIGRRGASGLQSSLIGGVAEKVLREGQGRSVLVVD